MKIARKLSIASAAAVLAVGTIAGGVSAAAAAPAALVPTQFSSLDLSPAGPYSGGDSVTGTASGFEPNEQVLLSICIGGQELGGPEDCADLNGPNTALGASDADGNVELTIEVLEGEANFQSAPDHVCGNEDGQECVFSLSNFGGDGPDAIRVEYGASDDAGDDAGADDAADDAADDEADAGDDAAAGADDAGASDELAATGAGPAAQSALLGALLLSFGALLAVGTRRQAARK